MLTNLRVRTSVKHAIHSDYLIYRKKTRVKMTLIHDLFNDRNHFVLFL